MKVFKKAVSALLASIMCIPSGIISIASAEESDNMATTVTLTDSEHGIMQFSEECMENSTADQAGYQMMQINDEGEAEQIDNDGSVWSFNKGDFVEIELIPDDGYQPSRFTIKKTDGSIMAQKDTSDNVFSFVMPGESITVESKFTSESASKEERLELTDKDAIALQKRIDDLLLANDYYDDDFQNMPLDKREEFDKEVEDIRHIYFETFSDEQRAQTDAAKLFAAIITLNSFEKTSKKQITEEEAEELKEKIDALPSSDEIADPVEVDEQTGYAVCNYNGDNTEMEISSKEADKLFTEVSALAEEVNEIDLEKIPVTIDISPLTEMQDFFTSGSGITKTAAVSKAAARAADNDIDSKALAGTCNTDWSQETNRPLGGSYYSSGMNDYQSNNWKMTNRIRNTEDKTEKKYNSIAYCACADRPREPSNAAKKS